MANPVSQAIKALDEIKKVVLKFGENNEREMIRDFVMKLKKDLVMKLQNAKLMKRQRVHDAMKSLKDALQRTEAEVQNCQSTRDVIGTFLNQDIASKLNQLREEISEKMLSVVLESILSGKSVDPNIGCNIAAVYALHGPLRQSQYAMVVGLNWRTEQQKYVALTLKVAPVISTSETMKYMASTKSDVYSFGVILLETIRVMCAAPKDGTPSEHHKYWVSRVSYATMLQESELEEDLFDAERISGAHRQAAKRCVIIGLLCCLHEAAHRPSMVDVVDMLHL
ncbi:hypothetical protein HU200_049097 [Digitaria exilis]|uniref:Uncharacterized protein n=1 Tax=Digitaria exilis TaxID=1010633 RepID=A0A835AUE9_9POAL|nr:hypothetical protein HU200_049097 [Digitaria exilis]